LLKPDLLWQQPNLGQFCGSNKIAGLVFFLICSWSLPEKGTMPVIYTMKKRTSSSSSGPVEKKLQKQSEGLHLKNALKSHFPKGVTEMDFCG
jgi:hypothetical protein